MIIDVNFASCDGFDRHKDSPGWFEQVRDSTVETAQVSRTDRH